MTVDRAVDLAQRHKIIHGHSFSLAVRTEDGTEVGAGGVDDWHGMALGQHQAICAGIARLLRSPAHRVIHQRGDQMRKRERAGGMPVLVMAPRSSSCLAIRSSPMGLSAR